MKRRINVPFSLPRVLGAWALLLPGVVAFQPTFGGVRGYVAAFVGITVGAGIALVATRFRWGAAYWFLALLVSYLILGGPLVLPATTIGGAIPTLETLRGLTLLVFRGWNDLLTVATPAGDFSGPAAVPLIAGLLVGAAMVGMVRSTKVVYSALTIPVVWLAFCIAFGVRSAPTAVWLGAALGVGVLVWLTGHRLATARTVNTQILLHRDRGMSRTASKAIAAGVVIALAAGAAVGVNVLTGERANRQVLRDDITPPLNLHEFASPLMKYRLYELTQADDVLFRVEGMPEGARLRLAVLDTYDGNVFNVSQHSNQYLNVGRELPWKPEGEVTSAVVASVAYQDVWVPSIGEPSRLVFSGDRANELSRGLFHNRESLQSLTTAGFEDGTTLEVEAAPVVELDADQREAISTAGVGRAPLATVSRVPDVLVRAASDWTADATSTYEQLDIIATRLSAEGFYSNGADGISRSGHTTERLGTMFNAAQWVGDDEQYATAMALMATQLGIPARVVMGFHPQYAPTAPDEVWEVTGTQAHVWVEADLDGAGWVSFDPTPDRDRVPQTDVPRPKPKPKPQVDPPPNPPENLPEEPVVADEDAVNVDEDNDKSDLSSTLLLVLLVAAGAVGGVAILSSPFLVILGLKKRRATRRRTQGAIPDQVAGAWDEVVDRARDLGYVVPSSKTRREAAANLQQVYHDAPVLTMAHGVDASIFGAQVPDERHKDAAWQEAKGLRSALLAAVPWYRRPVAVLSPRSLRKQRTEAALDKQRKFRRAKAGTVGEQAKES